MWLCTLSTSRTGRIGARLLSSQHRLTEASLLTLFIRHTKSYTMSIFAGFKIKVQLLLLSEVDFEPNINTSIRQKVRRCKKIRFQLQSWPRDQRQYSAAVPYKSLCLTAAQRFCSVVSLCTQITAQWYQTQHVTPKHQVLYWTRLKQLMLTSFHYILM